MRHLITHGDRGFGSNPKHSEMGIDQIKNLTLPEKIDLIVIGTGKRFQEIYQFIQDKLSRIPVKYSPFCGSADGLEADYRIILVDGTLLKDDEYLGMINVPAFDAWKFIADLPDNTLLCAGGELLIALGGKTINQKGQLYELDCEKKVAKKIS